MSDEMEEALPAAIEAWDRVRRPNEQRRPFSAGFRAGWAARSAHMAELEKVVEAARALDTAIGQWAGISLSPEVARTWIALENTLDAVPATETKEPQ